jgi:hypothetical protein|tara:strand:+ start:288 stop:479 length:192 start_codon:yes stop_codon:yes gene_type:complete
MIAPTDAIDIIERILKSYRHDDILEKDPDPICALMDMHSILEHTENGLQSIQSICDEEIEKGK